MVLGIVYTTGRRVSERMSGWGDDGDDRGFVRLPCSFLTGRNWTFVTTDTCSGPPGFLSVSVGDEGENHGVMTD